MTRAARLLFGVGLLIAVIGAAWSLSQRSRGRDALAQFKAELRGKGERLSAQEFGFPRPPVATESLDQIQSALNDIGQPNLNPGLIELMQFVGPGQARVIWRQEQPRLASSSRAQTKDDPLTWEEFTVIFDSATDAMARLREATRHPPLYFYNDPTNWAASPKSPFVSLRSCAQWLMGDTIAALRENDLDRAAADLCALAQLTQFLREDLTLVSQMIRTAITGLAVAVSWEALQADGWSEEQLSRLQAAWEAVDVARAYERGMEGERVFGETAFQHFRTASRRERATLLGLGKTSGSKRVQKYFSEAVLWPLWRANVDADELFYLQQIQKNLDIFRQLHGGTSMHEVNRQFQALADKQQKTFESPLASFRYLFSSVALPNFTRAASHCVRNETQRRLMVAAIAIERHRLRHGRPPPDLNALVPQILPVVPMDLMSAKPLGYQLHANGSFTLYSVGEDGRDDGGDPNPASATNRFDLWTGKDAVWPKAVSGDQQLDGPTSHAPR